MLRGHAHGGHRGHEERHGRLYSGYGLAIWAGQPYAHGVRALARRVGFGDEVNLQLCGCLLRTGCRLLRRRREATHGALQLGFGIHKEICGAHDAVAGFQSLEHDNGIVERGTGLDLARFQRSLPAIDECDLSRAGLQDTGSGNDELAAQRSGDVDVDVHAGLQHDAGIAHDEAHAHGARGRIYLRKNLIDASAEFASGVGVHRHLAAVTGLQSANVYLRHVGVDPHGGKIGDGVELCLWLHVCVRQCIALDDVSRGRRFDCDFAARRAA